MKNPSGAPNMVWGMYILISLNRIYKIRLSPHKISALPGWISIQTGTRLVIDALRKKFGDMDYNDPRVQTVIEMAKSMELVKSNPGKVRENIFTFNNPGNAQRVLAENFVRGANSGVASSMYIHGNRIYSYGPHFPIAERHVVQSQPVAGTPVIIITNRKSPSKTTSGQIGLVKAAAQAAGMDVMYEELKPEAKGPAAYSNPGAVRKNIFTFNNPRGGKQLECCRKLGPGASCVNCGKHTHFDVEWLLPSRAGDDHRTACSSRCALQIKKKPMSNPRELNSMEQAAAAVGLFVTTWAPGDGQTRYRFFTKPVTSKAKYADYHQGDGLYTALGRKDAMAFIAAYGKGRSARTNPSNAKSPVYVIEGFTPFGRRGHVGRRRGEFRTTSIKEARARAEQIFQETGVVVGITQKNPLTRSEAGYLLRHAKADVTEAGAARRFGLTHEAKYAAGHARGIGFAVQETGPKAARKTWVDMHTKLDRVLRNPSVCSNPVIRGDKLPHHLQEEILRRFVHRWTTGNTQRASVYGVCPHCGVAGGKPSKTNVACRQVHPTLPLISDAQWLREHAFHVTKAGRLDARHAHAEPHYMADDARPNPLLQTIGLAMNPPTSAAAQKRQMVEFLKKRFRGLVDNVDDYDTKFNIEGAIYWFANDYHGDGGSALYSILSTSPFKPGPSVRGPEPEIEQMMYDALEQEYAKSAHTRRSNPPISQQWDRLTGRQRLQVLGFVGFDETASRYIRLPWKLLSDMVKQALEQYWNDSSSSRGTTRRRMAPVGVNPLTRREAGQVLKQANAELRHGSVFRPGHTRSSMAGQAFGRAQTVVRFGPRAARPAARKVIKRAVGQAGTVMSNPGALRLPAPGTKMTVAQAMVLARRIGDRGLIKECQAAAKLQTKANSSAKSVTWKHLPMGSKDKIDSVVALTHYGDSPEDMYRPPKGSKKGPHMYRHRWGDGTGRSKPVQVLASPSGKMIVKVMGPGQKVGDWMRG